MRVETTAGAYTAVRDTEGSRTLYVSALDPESIQTLTDGLEAVCGCEVVRTESGLGVLVRDDDFAQWLSFEVLNYIDYEEFTW